MGLEGGKDRVWLRSLPRGKEGLHGRCTEGILISTTAKANYQEEDAIIVSGNSCTSLGALAGRLDARPRYAQSLYAFPHPPSLLELWRGPGALQLPELRRVPGAAPAPRAALAVSQPVPCRARRAGGALRPGCAGARGGAVRRGAGCSSSSSSSTAASSSSSAAAGRCGGSRGGSRPQRAPVAPPPPWTAAGAAATRSSVSSPAPRPPTPRCRSSASPFRAPPAFPSSLKTRRCSTLAVLPVGTRPPMPPAPGPPPGTAEAIPRGLLPHGSGSAPRPASPCSESWAGLPGSCSRLGLQRCQSESYLLSAKFNLN